MGQKLRANVSDKLHAVINRVRIDEGYKKGKACRYLLDLALENASYPLKDYGNSGSNSCTIEIADTKWHSTRDYRVKHDVATKAAFFRDVLNRGASYYEDHS